MEIWREWRGSANPRAARAASFLTAAACICSTAETSRQRYMRSAVSSRDTNVANLKNPNEHKNYHLVRRLVAVALLPPSASNSTRCLPPTVRPQILSAISMTRGKLKEYDDAPTSTSLNLAHQFAVYTANGNRARRRINVDLSGGMRTTHAGMAISLFTILQTCPEKQELINQQVSWSN